MNRGFSPLFVAGQLDGSGLEVHVRPVQCAYLLVAGRRVAGESERQCVLQLECGEQPGELGGAGHAVARDGGHRRQPDQRGGIPAGQLSILRPTVEGVNGVDDGADPGARQAPFGELVDEPLDVAAPNLVEPLPPEPLGDWRSADSRSLHARGR